MVRVLGFGGVGFGPGFMVSGFRVAPNCPQVSSISSSGFGALQAFFSAQSCSAQSFLGLDLLFFAVWAVPCMSARIQQV